MSGLLDFLQAASNTAADTVAAPVDVLSWALRKAGVPVPQNAIGSTEWMKQVGLRRDVPQSAASLAGETVGLLSPAVAAAKAPQIARGLLQMEANAMAPTALRPDAGALLMHTAPVDALNKTATYDALTLPRNEVRQLIQSDADLLANTLRQNGFEVQVAHGGSLVGPSSYLQIYDPTTGRMFKNQVRLSNHSKGPFESQFVTDVKSKDDFERVLEQAQQMREIGKSAGLLSIEAREAEQAAKTRAYWEQVAVRANSKIEAGQSLSNREQQALNWVSKNSAQTTTK